MAASSEDWYHRACEKFNIERFVDFQENSIDSLLNGKDVFLSTKTGGGKSLVYQAFQFIWKKQRDEKCQVVIVTPLLSIMKEQCDFLNLLGFKATYIGRDTADDLDILEGHYDFLFTSLESLLGMTKWRDMLSNSSWIRLLVVDEAHTINHWGESDRDKNSKPFREWFGKLGEMHSLIQCPLLVITATANKAARVKIQKMFCMGKCFEIIDSPDRSIIKLFLHKYKGSRPLSSVFQFLIKLLRDKKENCERHIIYCTSKKTCAEVFTMFRLELGSDIKYLQMYHSQTVEYVKDAIKKDMENKNGTIRVLVATSAAGMGVNFKDVNSVINFGVPKDMDSFVQQFGRAGRDGSQAKAILLFCGKQCRGIDSDMKDYITNSTVCRREIILGAYNTKPNKSTLFAHMCCDICGENCQCNEDNCNSFNHPIFELTNVNSSDDETSTSNSDSPDDNFSDFFHSD